MSNETQQLRIDMDAQLHERLKVHAARERTTIKALVTEAVERLLDDREGGRK